MNYQYLLFTLGLSLILLTPSPVKSLDPLCPSPILSRLNRHKISPTDTLESIAEQYNLTPNTIILNNPDITPDSLPLGTDIIIPPVNGIIVTVPDLASWQDLAEAYGVRADLLFEVNGCQPLGEEVFIPGITWHPDKVTEVFNYTGLSGYPLPTEAAVILTYGWQDEPSQAERLFHSGVDLLADVGTNVLAVEAGTVVYVGIEGNYGNLIIINHQGGLQTRYAHLQNILVDPGDLVETGQVIGTVGVTGTPDVEEPHLHFEVRYQTPMGWLAQDPLIHLIR
ncbi:MAG: LysM peptidoglycan-binding domain-containing protein [Gloeocapsa sp. DLM2.Bin57]|nr:MAG: LysM peptidoglycan-binding domain-containing protein [Gloeocapsa sp. DLM2.Bin57]